MKESKENKVEGPAVEKSVQPTEMIISIELAQSVLNYLGSKPYAEVADLVSKFKESKLQ